MLLLFVFQNVEAQQQDYDKLISKTLNEQKIYEEESATASNILNDKLGFIKKT